MNSERYECPSCGFGAGLRLTLKEQRSGPVIVRCFACGGWSSFPGHESAVGPLTALRPLCGEYRIGGGPNCEPSR
jgi:hypothetical protein